MKDVPEMAAQPVHYVTGFADSARWRGFQFRPDDLIISAPAKCGTTWMQMICALLVFQDPEFPTPLTSLSPWLDVRAHPIEEVMARLEAQRHRRFIKTHTPLNGLPRAPEGVTHIVVGRDPRDAALSMDKHRGLADSEKVARLAGADYVPDRISTTRRDRILAWINEDRVTTINSSLRLLVAHLTDAWARQHDGDVILLHYADLDRDLAGTMRQLAERLDIDVPMCKWDTLVDAATLPRMRARSAHLVPDERLGTFTDPSKFFGSGGSGGWRDILTADDVVYYQKQLATIAKPDLIAWLHGGSGSATR